MTLREVELSRSHHAQRTHLKQIKNKKSKRERERRKLELAKQRKRRLELLPATLNDNQVLTFKEWCALNRLSERNGRRIVKAPGGPTLTQISARHYGVTVRHNREWQASRERA
jgi:hypothetical protein